MTTMELLMNISQMGGVSLTCFMIIYLIDTEIYPYFKYNKNLLYIHDIYTPMPRRLDTIIKEIRTNLEKNNLPTHNIPTNIFKIELMIITGYNKKKVNEWLENMKLCKLITEENEIINFK